MRLGDEERAAFSEPDTAWRLLAPWGVTLDNATLVRHALYAFQARLVERRRDGRLLPAGDAVDLEGQLDLVPRGADGALLDTHGPERADHVADFIAFSMEPGGVVRISALRGNRRRCRGDASRRPCVPALRPSPHERRDGSS